MPGDETLAYAASAGGRLYQGEILSNVIERPVKWTRRTEEGDDEFGFDEISHPYVVLVTQDCDLEQDANARVAEGIDEAKRQKALLPSLLLVVASEFESARDFGGTDIKRRVKQNKDERYQFVSAVPATLDAAGSGIPSLVLDFKRLFSYPTAELLRAIERNETRRRARLVTPYAEHLACRFGYFAQRIGLPRDHHDFES